MGHKGSNPLLTASFNAGIQGIGQSHKLGPVGSNPTSATNQCVVSLMVEPDVANV